MIHDLGLFWSITWALFPYLLIIAIVIVTIWMLIEWIPIWIKRWKDLDNDWWE